MVSKDKNYISIRDRPRTIFIDIDGCLFRQGDLWPDISRINQPLPGVKEKLKQWQMQGDRIILVTARPKAYRMMTENQLRAAKFVWDELIMGLPTGVRVLVNDLKIEEPTVATAVAVNLTRDQSWEKINMEKARARA